MPSWVVSHWLNAPAVILRNLVVSALDRLSFIQASTLAGLVRSHAYFITYLPFVLIVWYIIGSKIDLWSAQPHPRTWYLLLWNSVLVFLGLLIGYAGIYEIRGRFGFIFSTWLGGPCCMTRFLLHGLLL